MPDPGAATVVERTALQSANGRGRLLTTWWPLICALAASIATFLLVLPAGLWNDDLANLQQHAHRPLGDLLLEPVFFTQVAPGHRLLTELQLQVGAADRIVMHALVAVLVGACVVVGARAVATLARPSWWLPFLLATTLAGPAGLGTNLWYAAWFHVMPALLAGLVAVLLYARWRGLSPDELPPTRPTGAVIAVAVGLLFSVKVLLAVLLLVLLEYLLVRRGDHEVLFVGLWRDRRVWIPFAFLGAGYWFYSSRSGAEPVLGDAAATLEATWQGISRVSLPMFLGLAPAETQFTQPLDPLLLAAAWIVSAVLVAFVVRRGDLAQRGVAIGLVVLAAGVAMSTWVRVAAFGAVAALTPRYHLDGLVYLVVAVGLGVLSAPATAHRRNSRHVLGTWWWWRGRALPVAAAAALIVAIWWSNTVRLDTSPVILSGRWLDEVTANLKEAEPRPMLLDAPLPFSMVSSFPGRRISELTRLVPGLEVSRTSPDAVATRMGSVEPLRTEGIFEQTGAEYAGNGLVAVTGDAEVFGSTLCTRSQMTLSLVLAPHPEPRLLELVLDGAATARTEYVLRHEAGWEPSAEVVTDAGRTRVVLPMDLLGWVEQVNLDVQSRPGAASACLDVVRFLEVHNDLPGGEELPS